jgi:hypothetical protein
VAAVRTALVGDTAAELDTVAAAELDTVAEAVAAHHPREPRQTHK